MALSARFKSALRACALPIGPWQRPTPSATAIAIARRDSHIPRPVDVEALKADRDPVAKPRRWWSNGQKTVSDLATAARKTTGWEQPDKPYWWAQCVKDDPRLAMDSLPFDDIGQWANLTGAFNEGLGFFGYPYLAELTQRPEFRRVSEIWAAECTRKWIKLHGDNPERIEALEKEMVRFGVREKFREALELDGFFGRGHIYMDFGAKDAERREPVTLNPEVIEVDSLKNLKVTEPLWVYPLNFVTNDPLSDDFYAPVQWQVMSDRVHNSRMLTFVGRELPDMLKPLYMFGGLSLLQMAKPYIDNFIRNRTSVGNLLHSFSTMVLSTDMATMLAPGGASELIARLSAYTMTRENNGVMVVDKEREELTNVSAPITGLDKLLAQSQEFIASVVGIPLVVLLGITPSGLNASSDGELKAFYAHIKGYQEKTCQGPLNTILRVLQLNMDGQIDESVTFEFVDLWELDDEARARIRQIDAGIDTEYMDRGVVDGDEVRERITADLNSTFHGMDLHGNDDAAPGQDDPTEGEDPDGDDDDGEGGPPSNLRKAAQDAVTAFVANNAGFAQDADGEHWITVHPNGEEPGRPLLIKGSAEGGYTVIGGAGGKLNGQTIKPGSMSKPRPGTGGGEASSAPDTEHHRREHETHHDWANRLGERAKASNIAEHHEQARKAHLEAADNIDSDDPESWAKRGAHRNAAVEHQRSFHRITRGPTWAHEVAQEASDRANAFKPDKKSTEELAQSMRLHRDASVAHADALDEMRLQGNGTAELSGHHRASYEEHRKSLFDLHKKIDNLGKRNDREKKREAAREALGESGQKYLADTTSRFTKGTKQELHEHFSKRYGLNIHQADNSRREYQKLLRDREFLKRYHSSDMEVRAAARAELNHYAERTNGQLPKVSNHTDTDVDDGSEGAKKQREALGHVAAALDHLEGLGFDIKGALDNANVAYTPGSTGRHLGHAFQIGQRGYFSISSSKSGLETMADERRKSEARRAKGIGPWTVGSDGPLEHMPRATVIHELAHALGMQRHINSPGKLQRKLQTLFPDYAQRHKWIIDNISQYGAKNIHETDAELAAKVTSPDYERGTLPKELEDHVDELFKHKGR